MDPTRPVQPSGTRSLIQPMGDASAGTLRVRAEMFGMVLALTPEQAEGVAAFLASCPVGLHPAECGMVAGALRRQAQNVREKQEQSDQTELGVALDIILTDPDSFPCWDWKQVLWGEIQRPEFPKERIERMVALVERALAGRKRI